MLALLCGGLGVQLGGALFGSSGTATATSAKIVPLPTAGSTSTDVSAAVVDINTILSGTGRAAGTGMILTPDGLVLTNNHVIADATDIRVQVSGAGPIYAAKVLGYDITHDVALLQIDGASNLPTISVGDSAAVAVGDRVVALGNALGKGGAPAVSEGSITALDQTISAGDGNGAAQTLSGLIEVNARLLPGDSGGPLVNTAGQVIGMNAAASAGNRPNRSDGFAIPINAALAIAHQIQSGQGSDTVHIGDRALLGVQVQEGQRAVVVTVQPGSPADSAGISAGDVIVSVDGTTISSAADLHHALADHRPDDRVSIGWVDGGGQRHTATAQLIAGPPA